MPAATSGAGWGWATLHRSEHLCSSKSLAQVEGPPPPLLLAVSASRGVFPCLHHLLLFPLLGTHFGLPHQAWESALSFGTAWCWPPAIPLAPQAGWTMEQASPASRPGLPCEPSERSAPGPPEGWAWGHPMLLGMTAGVVTWSAPRAAGLLLQTRLWLLPLCLLGAFRGCGVWCWRWGQGISFCREENTVRPYQALGTKLPDILTHPWWPGKHGPKVTHT